MSNRAFIAKKIIFFSEANSKQHSCTLSHYLRFLHPLRGVWFVEMGKVTSSILSSTLFSIISLRMVRYGPHDLFNIVATCQSSVSIFLPLCNGFHGLYICSMHGISAISLSAELFAPSIRGLRTICSSRPE